MVLLNILYDIFMISSQKNIIHKNIALRKTELQLQSVVTLSLVRVLVLRMSEYEYSMEPTYLTYLRIVLYFIFSNIGSAPIIELGSQCDMDGCIDLFC